MKIESPIYRFEKFDKNWLFVKISDLASQFKTGGTPSTKEPTFWGGSIPWIQSSDIQKDILFGVIPQKFISEEGLQNSSAKLIPKNSIAIVTRVGVGKLAIIDQDYATSQDFLSLSDFDEDILFIVYSIYRMLQKESTQLQGTSIKGITKEDLLSKKICLPEIDEQSAIGSLFRTLDDLLASYKDNLANYRSLKATMLSKMFPKAGQTVPEIRLDGFEGEWEVLRLSDICQKVTEKNKDNNFNETFTNSAEFGIINQRDFFEKDISNVKSLNTYYVVRNNDFVYNPRISNYAPVGPVKRNKLGRTGVMSPLYFVFRIINSNIDLNFLETFFNTNIWHKFMKLNGDSGARADRFAIKDSIFLTMPIAFPSHSEQQAIGSYFSNLDNLIAAHQEKISQLETLKKKLLQDMFI
jgi:restriction modification system DNA specificity domain protein